jgi:dolichyl-diphosphooligosaccharide--protein glycosyltransferase
LILLTAPIGSILGGIAAGRIFAWCVNQWWSTGNMDTDPAASNGTNGSSVKKNVKKNGRKSKYSSAPSTFDAFNSFQEVADSLSSSKEGVLTKRTVALIVLVLGYLAGGSFITYCFQLSETLSNPTIVQKARLRDGRVILLDDYRDAYNWLKEETPEDSRVMAWWDYGYQIAGIANRTTIADGNTWNHEHIALLGKAFTTDLDTGYEITRHWADYVLIWGGGMGDDLGKSPHLARIANSGKFRRLILLLLSLLLCVRHPSYSHFTHAVLLLPRQFTVIIVPTIQLAELLVS